MSGAGRRRRTWQDIEDQRLAATTARPHERLHVPLLESDGDPDINEVDESLPIEAFASHQQTNEHCMNNGSKGMNDNNAGIGQLVTVLQPLRQPLRVKRSVRCQASNKILIRPNVNPQQGDSNFSRNQSARWFEMNEFATEYIPRIMLYRVTAQDVVGGSSSVLVEIVIEIRRPRAIIREEDKLTLNIKERAGSAAALAGVVFDIPPAPLVLTKTEGTTKDQTAATTDPANKSYVMSCADGAVLLRMKAVAPEAGPVTFPLSMHVSYPAQKSTCEFSYDVDIDTVSP